MNRKVIQNTGEISKKLEDSVLFLETIFGNEIPIRQELESHSELGSIAVEVADLLRGTIPIDNTNLNFKGGDFLQIVNGFLVTEPGKGIKFPDAKDVTASTVEEALAMAIAERNMRILSYNGIPVYEHETRNDKRDAIILGVKEKGADNVLRLLFKEGSQNLRAVPTRVPLSVQSLGQVVATAKINVPISDRPLKIANPNGEWGKQAITATVRDGVVILSGRLTNDCEVFTLQLGEAIPRGRSFTVHVDMGYSKFPPEWWGGDMMFSIGANGSDKWLTPTNRFRKVDGMIAKGNGALLFKGHAEDIVSLDIKTFAGDFINFQLSISISVK